MAEIQEGRTMISDERLRAMEECWTKDPLYRSDDPAHQLARAQVLALVAEVRRLHAIVDKPKKPRKKSAPKTIWNDGPNGTYDRSKYGCPNCGGNCPEGICRAY